MDLSLKKIADIASLWGIAVERIDDTRPIAGSPERTLLRAVCIASDGKPYLLEKVSMRDAAKKERIAQTLAALAHNDLPHIIPYRKSLHGRHVVLAAGGYWQLQPFIDGVGLDRAQYYWDEWRAPLLAGFLVSLRAAVSKIPQDIKWPVFDLGAYIRRLRTDMQRCHPAVYDRLSSVMAFVDTEFISVAHTLPTAFCHGDYHALNCIWADRQLLAVIDWEFCGIKPELYDVANMVGCLGVEDPACLDGELVTSFIRLMKEQGGFSPISWHHFGALVLTLRFAWLSEWLRKNDEPMIDLECSYMNVLLARKDVFNYM